MPNRPGFDQIAQGHGRADVDHWPAGPRVRCAVGIPVADLTRRSCSPRWASWWRCWSASSPGKGQAIDTSLLQAQIFMLDFQATRWLTGRRSAAAGRQQHPDLDPDRRVQDVRRLHQHRGGRDSRCGCAPARRSAFRQYIKPGGIRTGSGRSKNRDADEGS
jgi:crotonobetainyl-CoA:carnitine CoA-transferase CaiB-like acyl-CoA transferase